MNIVCKPSDAFEIASDTITLKEYPDDLLVYFSGEDTDLDLTVAEGLVSPIRPTEPDPYHVKVKYDHTEGPYTFIDKGYELTYYRNNFRNFNSGSIRFTVKKEDCENDYSYQDLHGYEGVEAGVYSIIINVWRRGVQNHIITYNNFWKLTSSNKGDYYLIIDPEYSVGGVTIYKRYTCKETFEDVVLTKENLNTYFAISYDYMISSFYIPIIIHDGDDILRLTGREQLEALSQLINDCIENANNKYGQQYNGSEIDFPRIFKTEVCGGADDYYLKIRTAYESGIASNYYISVTNCKENDKSLHTWFSDIRKPSYFCAPSVDTKVISLHEKHGSNNELSIIHRTDGNIYLYMSDANSEFIIDKKLCAWEWNNEDFVELELNFDDSLSNFLADGSPKAFFETVGVNENGEYDSVIRSKYPETYLTLVGGGDGYGFREIDFFNKKQHCGAYKSPESINSYNKDAYIEYKIGDVNVFDDSTLAIEGDGEFLIEALDGGIPLSFTDEEGQTVIVKSNNMEDFIGLFKKVDYDPDSTLSFEASDLIFRITYLTKGSKITKFEFDNGTEVYDSSDPYNFEDIYEYVRRSLGAPQIACELTDDQIYDALCKAVEKYNKYRNWNENLNISEIGGEAETDLKKVHGGKAEGDYYLLPANVSDKDIVDIFFQPRFSVCWFGAGDSFLNNVMAQTFFGLNGGIVQNSADYYIHRVSCNDISNIIGTQVSWRVYNHHLYLTPNNLKDLEQFTVGIVYRPALTIDEIRNSQDIKALTLAYAMRTLGLIRGSFGGSIQAGDIAIQLNAETLLAEADKLEEKTIALLKSEQKPLWIIWS